jgi:Stress responsive A/B Barrel Domain
MQTMATGVKHIVFWNVAASDEAARLGNIEKVRTVFEALRGKIPGLLKLEIGVDVSRVDYACDVALYTEFESLEALHGYAIHPEHLSAKAALGNIRIARHQVDYTF